MRRHKTNPVARDLFHNRAFKPKVVTTKEPSKAIVVRDELKELHEINELERLRIEQEALEAEQWDNYFYYNSHKEY